MDLDDIPDDIGDPGVGTAFRTAFEAFVRMEKPGVDPRELWRQLWRIFDQSYAEESDRELAARIIDWFLAGLESRTDLLDP
jgi:hypothetical protein